MRFRTDDTTTEADARELWPVHHSDVFGDMADQGTWGFLIRRGSERLRAASPMICRWWTTQT